MQVRCLSVRCPYFTNIIPKDSVRERGEIHPASSLGKDVRIRPRPPHFLKHNLELVLVRCDYKYVISLISPLDMSCFLSFCFQFQKPVSSVLFLQKGVVYFPIQIQRLTEVLTLLLYYRDNTENDSPMFPPFAHLYPYWNISVAGRA